MLASDENRAVSLLASMTRGYLVVILVSVAAMLLAGLLWRFRYELSDACERCRCCVSR